MEVDESVAELASSLDAWLDKSLPVFSSQDRSIQSKAIDRGIAIIKELDRLKAKGMAAIRAALDEKEPVGDRSHETSLIQAFAFGARLADALHDEFLDTDGEAQVWSLLDQIVLSLQKSSSGRASLDTLLGSPDPGVRGAAGAYLIDLMPDRVIPMLQNVHAEARGQSAGFGAYWTLLSWERERKSRFNHLNK